MVKQSYNNGRKDKILTVANDLFSKYPYHRVSMDIIAQGAHVAKGTLYYHFRSKEDLYASLLHEKVDGLLRRLQTEFDTKTVTEKLIRLVHELLDFFHENRDVFLVLQSEETVLFSKRLKNCYAKVCTVKELLVSLIKRGIDEGIFMNANQPEMTAEMVLGMIKAPAIKGGYERDLHAETVVRILFNGLTGRNNV